MQHIDKADRHIYCHPATNTVENHLGCSERCLVVWGLARSHTIACCQNIQFNQDRHAMRISVRAGCPAVEFDHEAGDLEAQWTLGITRLDRFLRDGWVQSGAFTVSAERLVALLDRF